MSTQTIATGMMLAWTTGWLMGLWARKDRRTYVNTRPNSSTDRPRRFQRSSTAASTRPSPSTTKPEIIPKPQPSGGHLIVEGRFFGGYQPRPQQGTPNPPPSEP